MFVVMLIPVVGMCFLFPWIILVVCIAIVSAVLKDFATRAIVLENMGIFDAIKYSFKLSTSYFVNILLSYLSMFVANIVFVIGYFIVAIVVLAVFAGIPAFLGFSMDWAVWTIILLVFGIFAAILFLTFVVAPYYVMHYDFFTKVYCLVSEDSKKNGINPNNISVMKENE